MIRREKVFGPGRAVPLDRNAKARIMAYARTWSARHRRPGQHRDPITRAFLGVLQALIWDFHNSRSGCCFPSYETIAGKAILAGATSGPQDVEPAASHNLHNPVPPTLGALAMGSSALAVWRREEWAESTQ